MVANENNFSAWELETIFHMAKNSAMKSDSPFFEKKGVGINFIISVLGGLFVLLLI